MVVVLPRHRIAYFPIPKAANSSVRWALRELRGPESPLIKTWNNPMSARMLRISAGCFRFTVVRDPVERLLSCYTNRVIHHRDLENFVFTRVLAPLLGRSLKPDADTFFTDLRAYIRLNDNIRRHAMPQGRYLGRDLSVLDRIYTIRDLDRLAADLSERVGQAVRIPHLQTGGPKIRFADLSPEAQQSLLDYCADDYALLADFFTPPATSAG